jgi:hypothetical protein
VPGSRLRRRLRAFRGAERRVRRTHVCRELACAARGHLVSPPVEVAHTIVDMAFDLPWSVAPSSPGVTFPSPWKPTIRSGGTMNLEQRIRMAHDELDAFGHGGPPLKRQRQSLIKCTHCSLRERTS